MALTEFWDYVLHCDVDKWGMRIIPSFELLKRLVDGMQPGTVDDTRHIGGQTALLFCCQQRVAPSVVKKLLEKGGDPNAQCATGCTCLSWAIYYGNRGLLHLLLDFGASAFAQSTHLKRVCADPFWSDPFGKLQYSISRRHVPQCPDSFFCAITSELMVDPVIDKEGHSYERAAIEQWLHMNQTSPITRERLSTSDLFPNRALKDGIAAFEVM
jgi:hypothetical protein